MTIAYTYGIVDFLHFGPMRMPETGECPKCRTEIIRKNITGDIEVELIEE